MLVISADSDQTVPWAIANAAYKKQKRNQGVTEIVKMPGRGHALTIDAGWREVAEKALEFVKRFASRHQRIDPSRSGNDLNERSALAPERGYHPVSELRTITRSVRGVPARGFPGTPPAPTARCIPASRDSETAAAPSAARRSASFRTASPPAGADRPASETRTPARRPIAWTSSTAAQTRDTRTPRAITNGTIRNPIANALLDDRHPFERIEEAVLRVVGEAEHEVADEAAEREQQHPLAPTPGCRRRPAG